MLGANVLQSLNGSVNAVWVGRLLGEAAIAATSNANLVLFLLLGTMFGIGMGHEVLALANGFETEKLVYGHRGSSQPVKDRTTGRVYVTSQNHGYAVKADSICSEIAEEYFVNVNDKTCEGICYTKIPAFTVQFMPDASHGFTGTTFLFEKFFDMIEKNGEQG